MSIESTTALKPVHFSEEGSTTLHDNLDTHTNVLLHSLLEPKIGRRQKKLIRRPERGLTKRRRLKRNRRANLREDWKRRIIEGFDHINWEHFCS